jgi:hypothetical protein
MEDLPLGVNFEPLRNSTAGLIPIQPLESCAGKGKARQQASICAIDRQQEGMIALALVTIESCVLFAPQGFVIVLWTQHSFSISRLQPGVYSFLSNSTSRWTRHIGCSKIVLIIDNRK